MGLIPAWPEYIEMFMSCKVISDNTVLNYHNTVYNSDINTMKTAMWENNVLGISCITVMCSSNRELQSHYMLDGICPLLCSPTRA